MRYGAFVMDSMPPATMTWAEPTASRSCASMAAFMPEPHILFTVVQPAASGSPPPSEAWRAGAWPCPAGSTQPMMTSSTSSGFTFARSTAARMAAAPSSGAAQSLSSPWNAPIGVRAAETMTIGSACMGPPSGDGSVAAHEALAAVEDILGKRTGFPRGRIHVHPRQVAHGGEGAALGVVHLVDEARHLLAHFEERRAHDDDIAGEQLALVSDVLLHGGHRAPLLAQECRGDAHRREEVPRRLVELADIPHDVHMAHVVALPRVHRAAIGLR